MIVILSGIIIILIYIIIHKSKQYKELHNESVQDKILIATYSEFVMQVLSHSEYEIVENDMINAVKTCVNKEIYDLKMIDDTNNKDTYECFAEQVLTFVQQNEENEEE